jgi:hypothetical protein
VRLTVTVSNLATPMLRGNGLIAGADYLRAMIDGLTPEYWRARAAETRTLAENMKDQFSRDTMQRIARDYEMLAQRAEEREQRRERSRCPPPGV